MHHESTQLGLNILDNSQGPRSLRVADDSGDDNGFESAIY